MESFASLVQWQIGDGKRTLFWKDRWIRGYRVEEISPLVATKVRTQVANRRSVHEGLASHTWTNDIVGDMDTDGLAQFIQLWEVLMEVHPTAGIEDKPVWAWTAHGDYSAVSAYRMLCEGGIRFQLSSAIWKNEAPLACKIYVWLAVQYRLWTSDRRFRHGLQDRTSPCYLCDQEEDNVDHILLQCVYARQVWFQCFTRANINLALLPTQHARLEDWWAEGRKQVVKSKRKGFDTLIALNCWCLWKQRNGRVFGGARILNEGGTTELIFEELKLWAVAGAKGVQQFIE